MKLHSVSIARYILNGREPVLCEDLQAWTRWMDGPGRIVEQSDLTDFAHNAGRVCTTFLGIDVDFAVEKPVLFETLVVGGYYDGELYRYYSWQQAEQGHARIVQRCVRGAGLVEPASLSVARELARRTIKKAGKMNVACLIERSFHGYQPSK